MSNPFPQVLRTPRLLLRTVRIDDAEWIFREYASDPEVTRYLTFKTHQTVDTVLEWLEGVVPTLPKTRNGSWAILQDGRGLGVIDAHRRGDHHINVGYAMARHAWGKGLMTEALIAVRDAAMALPEVHRFSAFADVENTASTRVMEKAGMVREGLLRRYCVAANLSEVPRDVYMHALIRD